MAYEKVQNDVKWVMKEVVDLECYGDNKICIFTASEVTTLWRDRNVCIIIIIIIIIFLHSTERLTMQRKTRLQCYKSN